MWFTKKKPFSVGTRIIEVTQKWPQEIRHSKFCEDSYPVIQEVKKKDFQGQIWTLSKSQIKGRKVLPSKKSNFELDLIIRNDIFLFLNLSRQEQCRHGLGMGWTNFHPANN